jgi:hypothetical protein
MKTRSPGENFSVHTPLPTAFSGPIVPWISCRSQHETVRNSLVLLARKIQFGHVALPEVRNQFGSEKRVPNCVASSTPDQAQKSRAVTKIEQIENKHDGEYQLDS